MKPLTFATLAMFLLSVPALAQTPPRTGTATAAPDAVAQNNLPGPSVDQTSGGKPGDPAPHIYKKGEHLSPSYGAFDPVTDWSQFHLMQPPSGEHWVKYGQNYLLVNDKDGLITDIIKAG